MTANCVTDLLIDRQFPAALIAPVLHHGQMFSGNIHQNTNEPARLRPRLPLAEIFIAVYVGDNLLHRFISKRDGTFIAAALIDRLPAFGARRHNEVGP